MQQIKEELLTLIHLRKLAGESAKLLANSIYGKCCERKSRFREISFVSGPAASAAVCSNHFRDMARLDVCGDVFPPEMASDHDIDPDTMPTLRDYHHVDDELNTSKDRDVYKVSMAQRSIHMDLPVQIAYICHGESKDKFSCKGLRKKNNDDVLNFDTYRKVLTTRQTSGGINCSIKSTTNGHVYTYEQPRTSFSYLYVERRVLDTEPLDL